MDLKGQGFSRAAQLLGSAALQRCANGLDFNSASAAEVELTRATLLRS
jgi:hypothetical protein